MFEGTSAFPDSVIFPSIPEKVTIPSKIPAKSRDETIVNELNLGSVKNQHLVDEVQRNFNLANHTSNNSELNQLHCAYIEAIYLAKCGLFEVEFTPEICIDEYGEFTFSHQSEAGYVDIGVRGVGELSYHVRNDIDPSKTAYDDLNWHDYRVPPRLYEAIVALREYL